MSVSPLSLLRTSPRDSSEIRPLKEMLGYFEEHTYMGPESQDRVAKANTIATAPFTGLEAWLKSNLSIAAWTEESSTVFRHRTPGQRHGPITRLISPSELGRELKPFVFLDAVQAEVNGLSFLGTLSGAKCEPRRSLR